MTMPVTDDANRSEPAATDRGPLPLPVPPPPFDFAGTVAKFETPLLRYVHQMLAPGREQAEEIVQETFLRLHKQVDAHGAASISNLSGWLFRVAHNLTMNAISRRMLERKVGERLAQDAKARLVPGIDTMEALDEMARKEACDRAMSELHNLSEGHRQVLLLKVIQGFTLREIGDVTGLAVSNVAYRLNGGLRELSRRLKSMGVI